MEVLFMPQHQIWQMLQCVHILNPASAFASINQIKAANAISLLIKESLKSEVGNRIHFASEIILNRIRNKGESRVHYKLEKYRKKGEYDILKNISANVTLIQLMD